MMRGVQSCLAFCIPRMLSLSSPPAHRCCRVHRCHSQRLAHDQRSALTESWPGSMKFYIDDLPILFPYPKIYPEQYAYMCDLKRTLDSNGHCVLEMPSGTGKTVSLLSLIVSYQRFYPASRKLIYCSRTVPEIEKALTELKRLMEYRARYNDPGSNPPCQRDTPLPKGQGEPEDILAFGLSSRKNLCVHPSVSKERKGKVVDARCRDMTNARVCERGRKEPGSVELCSFHEELGKLEPGHLLPHGVWTLEDVREYGKQRGICPYFAVRRMVSHPLRRADPGDQPLTTHCLALDAIRRHHHLLFPLPPRP